MARHPVAAFLVIVYPLAVVFALLRTSGDVPLLFNITLWSSLHSYVGAALPAFVVLAAVHGRAGVRDLARRSFRWRVAPRWYLFALLGLPIGVLLVASLIFGPAPLNALIANRSLLLTLIVPDLLLRIVFYNLAEEIGWTGFLQARLQDRYGPLKACALVEVPFWLWHVPDVLVDTGGQLPDALITLVAFGIAQFFGRVVIMWLYNRAECSVLLVGLFHATHNTTVNRFGGAFVPGPAESAFLIASGLLAVTAVFLVVLTRGRLAYAPNGAPPQLSSPTTPEPAGT